jgi:hypothetical protein
MHRTLSFVLAGLIACSAAIVVVTSGGLPERVATHFAFDGRANGWMSRDAYAWMMGILALVLPFGVWLPAGWLPRRWPTLVNLPFRDYWLAPARREATFARLERMGIGMALLSAGLMAALHVEVLEANRRTPPAAGDDMAWVAGAFVVAIVALIATTAWRFRVPKAVRR